MKFRLILIAISLFIMIISGCTTSVPTPTRDINFNFVFRDSINAIDTFQNTISTYGVKPPVTIKLYFTQEEMDIIHQKMMDINFFEYPTNFNDRLSPEIGRQLSIMIPSIKYYFRVQDGSIIKEVTWTLDAGKDKKADDFESLKQLIDQIVSSKEEYKKLPRPTILLF
jgi:hypothetical protein